MGMRHFILTVFTTTTLVAGPGYLSQSGPSPLRFRGPDRPRIELPPLTLPAAGATSEGSSDTEAKVVSNLAESAAPTLPEPRVVADTQSPPSTLNGPITAEVKPLPQVEPNPAGLQDASTLAVVNLLRGQPGQPGNSRAAIISPYPFTPPVAPAQAAPSSRAILLNQ
jgi:hypothetical protein